MTNFNKLFLLTVLIPVLVFLHFQSSEASTTGFVPNEFATKIIGTKDTLSFGENTTANAVFDSTGNLWVAEEGNNRIVEYKTPIATGETASVVLGQPNLSSNIANNGGISANSLNDPHALTFDSSGNLWVADKGNSRVLMYPSSNLVTGGSATIAIGQQDLISGTGNRGTIATDQTLDNPTSVKFDSGNLWIADGFNNRVLRYPAASQVTNGHADLVIGQGGFSGVLSNQGKPNATAYALSFPHDIAFDPSHNLWVVDKTNHRVLEFTIPFSNNQTAFHVIGQSNFISNSINQGGSLNGNTFYHPTGVQFDSLGNLWVTDGRNHRVLEFTTPFSTNQAASLVIGQPDLTHGLANQGGGSPATNTLSFPHGLVFNPLTQDLWITDQENNRLLKFTTPFSSAQSASMVLGQQVFTSNTVNGPGLSATTLSLPQDQVFDSSGNLWIADGLNNRILEYASPLSTGQAASLVIGQPDLTHGLANQGGSVGPKTLFFPEGVNFDSSGNLWVADTNNSRVLEFTTPFSTNQAASLVIGQPDLTHGLANQGGSVGPKTLYDPADMNFDSSGNLWIADGFNNRVLEYSTPFSTNQAASLVIGQPDLTHGLANQGGSVGPKTLSTPIDLTFDSSHNLWVADQNNNRMLKYSTPFSTNQAASLVIGQPDLTHGLANQGGNSPAATTLSIPSDINFDSKGNLWDADAFNNRVLEFTTPFSTNQAASLVIGQPDFVSNSVNNGGVSTGSLSEPQSLNFDAKGNLWVADGKNNREVKYNNFTSTTVISRSSLATGSNSFTLGTLTTTLTESGSWNHANIFLEQTDTNPDESNPVGVALGKFFEIVTNSPEIISSRTVSMTYTGSQITGPPLLSETTLQINRFNNEIWNALSSSVNTGTKTVTATTPGFSTFSLTGFTPATIRTLSDSLSISDQISVGILPKITSVVAAGVGASDISFSKGDTITVHFSQPTNEKFADSQNKVTATQINSMFTCSSNLSLHTCTDNLGSDITGTWRDPSTLIITAGTGGGPVSVQNNLIITPVSNSGLTNAARNVQVSPTASPIMTGDFLSIPAPFITAFVTNDPNNGAGTFHNGDVLTIIFSKPTNEPGGTGTLDQSSIGAIFSFSPSLGLATYTGKWVTPSLFNITMNQIDGANPAIIGTSTVRAIGTGVDGIRDTTGASSISTSTSPPLSGSFGTFTVSIPVASGGTAVTTLPSGIITQVTLPSGSSGTITISKTTAPTTGSGGSTLGFLGGATDISLPSGTCDNTCTFSFEFTSDDLKNANPPISDPSQVKIFHDQNNDGDFSQSGETLATAITTISPGLYLATGQDSHTSKFAIGGVVTVLALLGHGGNSASTQAFSAQGFLDLKSLSQSSKDAIQNENPYTPIKPSNDPTVPYYPLSLDGNNYLIARYANTIQTVTEKVGVPVNLQLESPDKTISHIALYTNMEGLSKEIGDSDTYIVYDKANPLQIVDPHGFFSDVKVKTTTDNDIGKFGFSITFAKPMPKSNIFIREWDEAKYSSDTKIKDAIQIIESPQNTQISHDVIPSKITSEAVSSIQPSGNMSSQPNTTDDITNYVKQWGGYSQTSISDSELLDHMGIKGGHIPYWFMKTSKWIVNGDTTQQEFTEAVKYMSEKGIIK